MHVSMKTLMIAKVCPVEKDLNCKVEKTNKQKQNIWYLDNLQNHVTEMWPSFELVQLGFRK